MSFKKIAQYSSDLPLNIHLWIPNMFEFKGGIQTYSAFLVQALQILYPTAIFHVFLLHDSSHKGCHDFPYNTSQSRFHFAGIYPSYLRTIFYILQILSFGMWQRPQLIITSHLNFTPPARLLQRLTGISYWTVAHGVEAWGIEQDIIKIALSKADRVLAVSHFTRDRMLQADYCLPDQIVVLPNTFDGDRFHIAPKSSKLQHRYGIPSDHCIILTVSRLVQSEQYKGYDRVLRALPQIRAAIPTVHYLLVGHGDDRPRIEHLIEELNLCNNVTLAGFIPDTELCDHYNLCDVFAMPSKREGFGIVYLEAMACGKPCVGGNKDGAVDALVHGELGVLVDPDDLNEIAQVLVQLLQGKYPNSLLYQPEELRQAVLNHFGPDVFQQRLAQYLGAFFPAYTSHSPITV